MNPEVIKKINREYETKRIKAYNDLVEKKKNIYDKIPRLQEIDDQINQYAMKTTRSILLAEADDKDLYVKDLENKIDQLKKEKENILTQNNISSSDLEVKYECNICNDTGMVDNHKCNCYKQKLINYHYASSNLFSLKDHNFDNFDFSLYSEEVDNSINVSPRKNITNIKAIADSFITNFEDPSQKNLLFTGESGLGKTYMSSCIANELLKKGKTVLYQTAPILMDKLIEYKFNKTDNSQKLYNDVFDVDLLIIDDLGVENLNSIQFTELFTIINTRLLNTNRSTKTIISTNLSIEEMFKIYEERIMSRIIGNYSICKFIGDDIRIKKR